MANVRVLIADDSLIFRSQTRAALQSMAGVEVVGSVANGRLACDVIEQSHADVLLLDLEMPEMDGLETLRELKRRGLLSTKVILFSSASKRSSQATFEALQLGARDFVTKPGAPIDGKADTLEPSARIRELIEPKLRAVTAAFTETAPETVVQVAEKGSQIIWETFQPRVVVIGSSTGGPTVLEEIFSALKGPLNCPILIVQHMPPVFTETLAERLQALSGIPTREAKDGEPMRSGQAYVAPGDYHLVVRGKRDFATLHLNKEDKEHFVRPAVDYLFRSAASVFGDKTLGIVLTGMGADGALGAAEIKRVGGAMLAQSQSTSAVYGMPKAVVDAGACDQICSPPEIIQILRHKVTGGS